ncbi:hypothetical protein MJT46_010541 [Ovis ammon polii x Ovis aries]|nr:hypothetical protein MJT46_010541 [Ovis ammon polii x Ovis aries]
MVSSPNIICSENGTWYLEVPKCEWMATKLRKCVLITAVCQKPEISNGKLSVEKDQYVTPETVTIRCNPGYRMVGSQNIFCSENKSWSPDVPKCEKVPVELCEAVLKGQKLLKCLPNAWEAKVALELHKLSLEIEKLEQEKRKKEIA